MAITIKNAREIDAMRRAGLVVSKVHVAIEQAIEPGMTTQDLDDIAKRVIREEGAISSFLGHHGFTGRICASINEEIVHGIPGRKVLKEGDIISVDVGAIVDGFHGDSPRTDGVGEIDEESQRLLEITEQSLYAGIAKARAGNRLGRLAKPWSSSSPRKATVWSGSMGGTVSGVICGRSLTFPTTGERQTGCASGPA
ncbi:MAG: M24 family metallopeptidase [Thermomicrobiales bacterium]